MARHSLSEADIHILMMRSIDGEISPGEAGQLADLLDADPALREEFNHLKQVKETTVKMRNDMLPDVVWEDYWQQLYNRLERGFSWILISLGAIVLSASAIYHIALEFLKDSGMPLYLKLALVSLFIGLVILLISVLRKKWFMRKHDPYRKVKR